MLCSICRSIDFYKADCAPYSESGGARHQPSFRALTLSADNGCELCDLIRTKGPRESNEFDVQEPAITCHLWNWYEGPPEEYRGSATIIFHQENSPWSIILGIAADASSEPAVMNLISGRKTQGTANSDICFDFSTKCFQDCLDNHKASCPYEATTSLPTRVLDVGSELSSDQVRLLKTEGAEGTWVALSHCWGRKARYVTETTTVEERIRGIAISELPKTFQDAVTITRKLGYRYLWIDSLCILQDSRQDWLIESRRMQDYYSKSVLTIASDLASGDHESFLDNERLPVKSLTIPFSSKDGTPSSQVYIFGDVISPGADSDATPLSIRGWTLQEDMLSPRTLHYTSTELVFECQRSRYTETDATPQGYTDVEAMKSIKRFFLKPEAGFKDPLLLKYPHFEEYYQPLERWYRLFENYCTRLLTFESDRLAAIAGLAKELQRQTSFTYKAGLWLEDMHHGLLWAVNGRGEKPEKYRAPSWSWAGLDIDFYLGLSINPNSRMYTHSLWKPDEDDTGVAEILGCELETMNGNPFGEVISAQLRLRGLMLPLNEWRGVTSPYINAFWKPLVYHQSRDTDGGIRAAIAADQLILDFDVSPNDAEDLSSEDGNNMNSGSNKEESDNEAEIGLESYPSDVTLIQVKRLITGTSISGEKMATLYCLLLEPEGDDGSQARYRRIGMAQAPDIDSLCCDGWSKQEVTIV